MPAFLTLLAQGAILASLVALGVLLEAQLPDRTLKQGHLLRLSPSGPAWTQSFTGLAGHRYVIGNHPYNDPRKHFSIQGTVPIPSLGMEIRPLTSSQPRSLPIRVYSPLEYVPPNHLAFAEFVCPMSGTYEFVLQPTIPELIALGKYEILLWDRGGPPEFTSTMKSVAPALLCASALLGLLVFLSSRPAAPGIALPAWLLAYPIGFLGAVVLPSTWVLFIWRDQLGHQPGDVMQFLSLHGSGVLFSKIALARMIPLALMLATRQLHPEWQLPSLVLIVIGFVLQAGVIFICSEMVMSGFTFSDPLAMGLLFVAVPLMCFQLLGVFCTTVGLLKLAMKQRV